MVMMMMMMMMMMVLMMMMMTKVMMMMMGNRTAPEQNIKTKTKNIIIMFSVFCSFLVLPHHNLEHLKTNISQKQNSGFSVFLPLHNLEHLKTNIVQKRKNKGNAYSFSFCFQPLHNLEHLDT